MPSPVATPVPTHNRFDPLSHAANPTPPVAERPGPSRTPPTQITNTATTGLQEHGPELARRADAVMAALECSDAPEAERLREFFSGALATVRSPEERAAVVARYERALQDRGIASATLRDLVLYMANTVMDGTAWRTLAGAAPGVGTALALAQLAQSIGQRSWQGVAACLPALAPALPSLRGVDQIDALIRSLPDALRTQLESLHDWVQQTDDALKPDLHLRHLGPALAVAALLWHLRSRLPSPSGQLQGVAGFIADLPQYWQRLVSLDRLGASLLAVPAGPNALNVTEAEVRLDAKRLPQHQKKLLVAHKRAFDRQYGQDGNTTAVPAFAFSDEIPIPMPGQVPTTLALDAARVPDRVQRGGPVATPPEPAMDAATSSAASWIGSAWTWLTGSTAAAGFTQVAQSDALREMVAMDPTAIGRELNTVTVETPLMDTTAPAATAAAGGLLGRGGAFIKRNPIAAATSLFVSMGTAAAAAAWYFWPSAPASLATAPLADQLAGNVVSLGDAWGTGLDLLLGEPLLPGKSRRPRSVGDPDATTPTTTSATRPPPRGDQSQLALTDAQRAQLLDDPTIKTQLLTQQRWAVAVAQDIATREGWEWVARLPASEQELLAHQLHLMQSLDPALGALQALPQALLDDALRAAGWHTGSAGLEVDLGTVQVAGVSVEQRIPLLEYCLLRADRSRPAATFLRDGEALDPAQQRVLQDFVAGTACAQLPQQVQQQATQLQPVLARAIVARLVIDAIKAKSQGRLGSGDVQLRGADIVLGFLQGAADVESATLTYVDVLADGSSVKFDVPNYLVLRSTSADPDLKGQVVLYRSDLAQFQSFSDEAAFREFLDANRARAGVHVINGNIDTTLIEDILAAAPPAQRMALREQLRSWEKRQVLFQTGKHGPQAWSAGDSFVFDFKPAGSPGHTLQDWASTLVAYSQTQHQQQLETNQRRWSPLGMADVQTDTEHARCVREDLQTLQQHAHEAVKAALGRALALAGADGALSGLDPDRVQLRLDGTVMSLTEWATSGWQQYGLTRPSIPVNLADLPAEGIGVPHQRWDVGPWPSAEALFDMELIVQRAGTDGAPEVDTEQTRQLLDEDLRRAICGVLDDFAGSNALGDAYVEHLLQLKHAPPAAFHAAVENQLRVHLLWMIEQAHQQGRIDDSTWTALKAAHGALDPANGKPSSLQQVTLHGHAIQGVWALKAQGRSYVFLPGTEAGDQLLDEKAFRLWLLRPEAEAYVLARAQLRHHAHLDAMFRKKQSAQGLKLGFQATQGPKQAARSFIDARLSDVDEMTVSQLERFTETLTLFISGAAAATCSLASGGALAAMCVVSTLALVAEGIRQGVDFIDRGDVDGAIGQIGGSVVDALDVLNIASIPTLLFQLGRRSFNTVADATDALRQWRQQSRGFTGDGKVNDAFATSRESLSGTGLPMLERPLPEGGTVYQSGGHEYIRLDDAFVETYTVPGEDMRRLRMPDAPDAVGPPVQHREGQWQRLEKQPEPLNPTTLRTPHGGGTTPTPPVSAHQWVQTLPDARCLAPGKLDELEAAFGIRKAGITPSPDLRQKVRDLAMEDRVNQVIAQPESLGLPGDEPIIMRAWADSPLLGNGRSVETYTQEMGEWNRGARFGKGPVGMMVEVDNAQQLPTMDQLIDASDQIALRQRLKLPPDSSQEVLREAVRAELARTIATDPAQSLLSWQRWLNAQHRLPTAADNLIKHFPMLTKFEAESLVAADRLLEQQSLSWIFTSTTAQKVAEIIAKRTERETRESVLKGVFDSPTKVQVLSSHLQDVIPGSSWRVTEDPFGTGSVLTFSRVDDKENGVCRVLFGPDGGFQRSTSRGDMEPVSSWEQGVYEQLPPGNKQTIPSSDALRHSVVEHMKNTPLAQTCAVVPKAGKGKTLVKKGVQCDLPPGITLSDDEMAAFEKVTRSMQTSQEEAYAAFGEIRLQRNEFETLRKLNRTGSLDPQQIERLNALAKQPLMFDKNFLAKNFVSYVLNNLAINGNLVELPAFLPTVGAAYSGPRVDWLKQFVGDTPMRRVLIPESTLEMGSKGKGKQQVSYPIPPEDRFRESYLMGADPVPTRTSGTRNPQSIELTLEDLGVHVPVDGGETTVFRRFSEMDDAELEALDAKQLSPTARNALEGNTPLPSNLRSLEPGTYWSFDLRACSEFQVLDLISKLLQSDDATLKQSLAAAKTTPLPQVSGEMSLVSEMHPCETSCNRRVKAVMETFQNFKLRVFYYFTNADERTQWRDNVMLNRRLRSTEAEWDAQGKTEAEAMAELLARFKDRRDPLSVELNEELLRFPLTQSELPPPRLWLPEDEVAEGF